ncbi:calcium-binding protein [Jannaschia seohaensis]|uniref:Hemolysin type calcium-binding protein n=1 Tax=Jannaschia seohaensis TaxID=475081 RepID=A0A2Y9AJI1_9RHOB|nr:calcium-binding protein [Jannaschia seohaensis]PWJ20212.1 hypothetical protein BCF38_10327 [Jannaschia seohaensis]SSA44206.1 hypothetical protein SAMN05421539_10327 [Jannaschia seohaensis]
MLTEHLVTNPEVLVNSDVVGRQEQPALSSLSGGGLVTVWVTLEGDNGVYGQLFDEEGNRAGAVFQVNTSETWGYGEPKVAPLPGGGFVTIWDEGEILAQLFDDTGAKIGGEIMVSAGEGGHPGRPEIAALEGGDFAVTWSWDGGADADQSGIYLLRFSGTGQPQGDMILVNTTTVGSQGRPDITGLVGGASVVSWTSYDDSTGYDIYSQRFDETGAAIGPEFRMNTTVSGWQEASALAGLSGGGFVAVWHSSVGDGDATGIFGQRYAADGTALGTEFQVNTFTEGRQSNAKVTGTADGGYVVAWDSFEQDGDGFGVYGQRFDASGVRIGTELRLNDQTASWQILGEIETLQDGSIAAIWSSSEQDGDANGVVSRRYGPELWGTQGADTLIDPGNSAFIDGRGGDDELVGGSGDNIIIGSDGNDRLDGGPGADSLNGGRGADRMIGGGGNDSYVVDDRDDRIEEIAGGGEDSVLTSSNFNLGDAEIEEVIFAGTSRQQVMGNGVATSFVGNDRVNILAGGGGRDTLEGGGGVDYFAFQLEDAPGTARIVDFQDGDLLALDDRLFDLGDGLVDPRNVTQRQIDAALKNGFAWYDRASGELTIDTDGRGGPDDPDVIAIVETTPQLGPDNIILF